MSVSTRTMSVDLAAPGKHVGCRRCLAKQHRRLAELALDGAEPIGKILGRAAHEEIGAVNRMGERAPLVRQPERSIHYRLQRADPCLSTL